MAKLLYVRVRPLLGVQAPLQRQQPALRASHVLCEAAAAAPALERQLPAAPAAHDRRAAGPAAKGTQAS